MKGEDIKKTIKKIKPDSTFVEKIKQLEKGKEKKLIHRTEFWGAVAAACWVLLFATFLFLFINEDRGNDPVIHLTPTEMESTPSITNTPPLTPESTETQTALPTPTPEPFIRLKVDTKTLKVQVPAGVEKRENIDILIRKGEIFVSVYNEMSKLYRIYSMDKTTGELKAISPELSNLKTGEEFVLYKKEDKYYTNSYNFDNERPLSIDTDDLIDVFIVSDKSVVYTKKISGYTSYIRYMHYDLNTKATTKVYELVVYGSLIGGIPITLPEPLYVVGDYCVLLNVKRDSLKIFNAKLNRELNISIHIHEHYGLGVFDEVMYLVVERDFRVKKVGFSKELFNGNSEWVELINSSEGYLLVDGNRLFLFNVNDLKGLFMVDVLTDNIYLLEDISSQGDVDFYVSDKRILVVDNFDGERGIVEVRIGMID